MADDEPTSGAQRIVYNVGVTLGAIDRATKTAERVVGVMERVKKLFASTEKSTSQSAGGIMAATSNIVSGGGAAGGGGGGGGIMSLVGNFNALGIAVGTAQRAYAFLSNTVVGLHQSQEDMVNTMAGTFQALGFASDITGGVNIAETALNRINEAAARLPGETSEYITVFQAGISGLAAGFNNNLDQMLSFSNNFAAIGRSLGVDAEQIGRDMSLMIREGQAGAGADVATFQRLLPFINNYRRSMGQAAVTAETFNRMQQPERLRLLEGSFGGLSDMISRAGNTYSALQGEFQSHITGIQRAITAPLFEGVKDSLRAMNGLLSRYEDRIKTVGASISQALVGMTGRFTERVEHMFTAVDSRVRMMVLPYIENVQRRAGGLFNELQHGDNAGRVQAGGGAMAAGALLGGPMAGLITGGFAHFMEAEDEVALVTTQLVNAFNSLMPMVYYIANIFGQVSEVVGDIMIEVLPGFANMIAGAAEGLRQFFMYMSPVISDLIDRVRPAVLLVAGAIGNLFTSIGSFLMPALRALAIGLAWVWERVRDHVIPIVTQFANAIASVINFIARMFREAGAELSNMTQHANATADDPISRGLARLAAATDENTAAVNAETAIATNRTRTPGARGGNRTHNDFRNSHFDITQKFAEGFDPDRIAAGFITDLEAAADNRLQGGFEPIFSIR
jgi:hypothetical protein